MRSRHPRRRPAVLPAVAFLAAVACGWSSAAAATAWAVPAAAVGALVAARFRTRHPAACRALLLCAVLGLGAGLGRLDRTCAERRAARLLSEPGSAVELHFRGELLTPPEEGVGGERILLLRGAPERERWPRSERSTVRLIVRASPAEPTRRLDALRPGQHLRVWCRLFRPRGVANPGSPDPARALAARGLDALGSVKSARLVERLHPGPGAIASAIDRLRRAARQRLDVALAGRPASRALAGAMLLGDRAALDPATWRVLRDSGLVHLVSISGLHVGLLGAAVVAGLRRSRLPAMARLLVLAGFLAGFGQLVGLRPSVLRALLGVALLHTGRAIGRDGDGLNSLSLVACALVACSPAALFDPGLQLTFLATAGILLAARGAGGPSLASGWLRVSAAAYLATAPVAAWHFGRLAPICFVSNLAAVPLCGLVLASGYGAMLAGDAPLAGPLAVALTRLSTGWLLDVARIAASFPAGAFPVAALPLPLLAAYYAAGLAATSGTVMSRVRRQAMTAAFAVAVLLVHLGLPPEAAPREVEVSVIDVGQGQAVAVRGRGGGAILVDAAGSAHPRFDPGERIVLPFLLRTVGRRVETLVLSHDDVDHAGGAAALLTDLEIGELGLPPGHHGSAPLAALAATARLRGTAVRVCRRGDEFERAGLRVQVLGPGPGDAAARGNDGSVCLRIGAAPYRVLVPGDVERAGERDLVRFAASLRAEALVLSHHGSGSGTSLELLERVRPQVALVSCGFRNPFGHPHPAVCSRVRRARAELWRTDLDGMLRLEARAGGWQVRGLRR